MPGSGLPRLIPKARHCGSVHRQAPDDQTFHITWLGKDADNPEEHQSRAAGHPNQEVQVTLARAIYQEQ